MGFLSKRKSKKEAKKAEANAAQAAADGAAAAQAVATKEAAAAAKVPGEIKIQHRGAPQSGEKQRNGGAPLNSGSKAVPFRRRLLGVSSAKRPVTRSRPPRSPGGQSHVSAITRETAFPETPKRRLFPPSSNLLPDDDYDYIDEEGDVGGGVVIAGRWAGDKVTTAPNTTQESIVADAKKKKKTGNMWTRSKNFKELTDWAFKTIDADGSGQVDKKELYTGLLMIHLKLATYAGPAACRPATREYCEKIFDQMDVDKSGELDRSEFEEVMQIVCAQVFTRVTIQWAMTLMIVPMIAQGLWKALVVMNESAWDFWMEIDELDPIRASVSNVAGGAWDKILSVTPGFVQTVMGMTVGKVDDVWAKIPEGIKETLPITLMSCILSCLLVPYCIFKMDNYHEQKAAKKGQALKQEKGIESSIVQK